MIKKQKKTITEYTALLIKGLIMGAANKAPGISGGMVAFVWGFYEEFIYSLQKFNIKALKLFVGFRWKSLWHYVNGPFLSALIGGILISYFSISKLIDYLLQTREILVWSFFFGLILGSIVYLFQNFKKWNKNNILFLCIGMSCGILISFLEPAAENDALWFVFLCGIISVSGLTLPGLSGSFILIILGNYVLLLVDSVNALFNALIHLIQFDFSFLENSKQVRLLFVLFIFLLGSITGLISLSHLLGYVIKKFKNSTYSYIIGFIIGTLAVVWPWKYKIYKVDSLGEKILDNNNQYIIINYKRYIPSLQFETYLAILWIVIGLAIMLYISFLENKKKQHSNSLCKLD